MMFHPRPRFFSRALSASNAPDDLRLAILRTVLYADIFDYPLTLVEIHRYLIGYRASVDEVTAVIQTDGLAGWLSSHAGYYTLRERPAIVATRRERERGAARLWRQARAWAGRLAALPFVRMVAVTGALSMNNAPADDDIDLLIVTAPGRVWLSRALCVALVRLARLAGVRLCPNYLLATAALVQDQQDLYIAHELAQMVPLAGHALYAEMRAANAWTRRFLPQADQPPRIEPDLAPRGWRLHLQRLGERLLGGRLGDRLEAWERARKQRKFASAARASAAAQLDADRVKGHFDDHGRRVLAAYHERLCAQWGRVPGESGRDD